MLRRLVAPGLGGGAGRILRGAGPAPWLAAARDVGFRSCSSQTPLAGQHGAIGLVWGDSDVTVHMPLPGVAGISALSFRGNETVAEVAGRLTQRDQSLHEASFTDAAGNPLPHATRLADLFPGRAFLALNGLSFGLSRAPSPKPATPPSVVNAVEAAVRREEAAVMDRAALCNLCVDCGGATTDAPAVLAALEQKGVLLQPRASSPQSCIILNPDGARDRIIRALDTDGAAIREAVAAKAADVAAKEEVRPAAPARRARESAVPAGCDPAQRLTAAAPRRPRPRSGCPRCSRQRQRPTLSPTSASAAWPGPPSPASPRKWACSRTSPGACTPGT